jgi:hypothetical protein
LVYQRTTLEGQTTMTLATLLILVGTILCGITAAIYGINRDVHGAVFAAGATLIGLGVLLGGTALTLH